MPGELFTTRPPAQPHLSASINALVLGAIYSFPDPPTRSLTGTMYMYASTRFIRDNLVGVHT